MIGYIYITTNLVNRKFYIGKREKPYYDKYYLGSGKEIQNAIKKYGKENFTNNVICWCKTHKELCDMEKFFIKKLDANNRSIAYNISQGGDGGAIIGHIVTPETREKMRAKALGRKMSLEAREKMRKNNLGKKLSKETRDKMSKNKIGKKYALGYKHTDEWKKYMSEHNARYWLGKHRSEETKRKISENSPYRGKPAWNRGKKFSEEVRMKMRLAKLGKPSNRIINKLNNNTF